MDWETARAQTEAERRTPSQRVLDLAPVELQTGVVFRLLGIVSATLKVPLFLSTAHWEPHSVVLALRPLPAPDCPIRSQSGTSYSEPELTDWPGNAVRSQQMRRCEERGRGTAWRMWTMADGRGGTVAGTREDATWRCHGNTERGGEGGRIRSGGCRARCRLRRCWSWATWSRTGWGTASCSMIGQLWRSCWLMGHGWRATISYVPVLCYRLLPSDGKTSDTLLVTTHCWKTPLWHSGPDSLKVCVVKSADVTHTHWNHRIRKTSMFT